MQKCQILQIPAIPDNSLLCIDAKTRGLYTRKAKLNFNGKVYLCTDVMSAIQIALLKFDEKQPLVNKDIHWVVQPY